MPQTWVDLEIYLSPIIQVVPTSQNIFDLDNVSADVYTYNSQGNLTSIKSRNGIRENYQYDLSNRLIKRQDENKNILEKFRYNYSTRKIPTVLP